MNQLNKQINQHIFEFTYKSFVVHYWYVHSCNGMQKEKRKLIKQRLINNNKNNNKLLII